MFLLHVAVMVSRNSIWRGLCEGYLEGFNETVADVSIPDSVSQLQNPTSCHDGQTIANAFLHVITCTESLVGLLGKMLSTQALTLF